MTALSAYCESADLYDAGLQRGALPSPGRLVSAVDTTTNIFSLDGHGFRSGAQLLFRAETGGALPSPLVAGTTYYALSLTDATFQVAASAGGAAIDLTTAGSLIVVSTPLPVQAAIEWASGMVDDFLPAHVVPLESPYPAVVVAVAADLAVARLGVITGGASADFVATKLAAAQKMLDRWAKGLPIRGAIVPPAAGLATVAVTTAVDPRGWIPTGGTLP